MAATIGISLIASGSEPEINGSDGDDRLVGTPGTDYFVGGPGADIFEFTPDGRSDFIMDFEIGVDKIDLSAFDGIYYYADLEIGARKNGAVIIVGEDIIRLRNPDGVPYDVSELDQDDFIFG